MIINEQKITLISTRRPRNKNVNEELKWLGASLGLFNVRDRDQSCFRIFIELLKSTKSDKNISSDENVNIDVKFAEDCVYTFGINIKLEKIADEILLQQISKINKILKQVLFKDGEMKHLIFEF